jgi:hypothetical protein
MLTNLVQNVVDHYIITLRLEHTIGIFLSISLSIKLLDLRFRRQGNCCSEVGFYLQPSQQQWLTSQPRFSLSEIRESNAQMMNP